MSATFAPVIGSSFDNLAAQQQFWANHNRSVEENNLQRAAAAQEALNRHAEAVSQAQHQDAANAYQMDQQRAAIAMQQAERSAGNARHDYEFGVQSGLEGDRIKVDKDRYQFAQKEKDLNEKKALDSIQKTAEFMAPDVADQGAKYEAAQQEFQKAHQDFTTLPSELVKGLPSAANVIYNPKLNEFVPANPRLGLGTDENKNAVDKANAQLAQAKANYDAVANNYQTHASNFENTKAVAQKSGLLVGRRGDKWVISSPNHGGQIFGDTPPLYGPPAPVDVPDTTTQPLMPWQQRPDLSAPATDGTGTLGYQWGTVPPGAAQPLAVQSPVKVGRFVVTPL